MGPITREGLDAGRIDFSDVVDPAAAPLATVGPGQVLRGEFLEPLGLSAIALARAIGVPRNRVNGIVAANRTITGDTALRLGIYFGTSAEFWLSLQANCDLKRARRAIGERLRREIPPAQRDHRVAPTVRSSNPSPPRPRPRIAIASSPTTARSPRSRTFWWSRAPSLPAAHRALPPRA